MKALCKFAGIRDTFFDNYQFTTHNPTLLVRNNWLNKSVMNIEPIVASIRAKSLNSPNLNRLFEGIVNRGKNYYYKFNKPKVQEKEPVLLQSKARLVDYYQDGNQALAKAMGRPLPWKSYVDHGSHVL